jgi:hypothetical protein
MRCDEGTEKLWPAEANSQFCNKPAKQIAGNDLWISRIQKADERACPSTADVRRVEATGHANGSPQCSGDLKEMCVDTLRPFCYSICFAFFVNSSRTGSDPPVWADLKKTSKVI